MFANNISKLGFGLVDFATSVGKLDGSKVEAIRKSIEPIKELVKVAKELKLSSKQDETLTTMATSLSEFGASIKSYAQHVDGIDDEQIEKIKKSKDAVAALSRILGVFKDTGNLAKDTDMSVYTEKLPKIGDAIVKYADSVSELDENAVSNMKSAANAASWLASTFKDIPSLVELEGKLAGIEGDSLSGKLESFGLAITSYANSLDGFPEGGDTKIQNSASAVKNIKQVFENMPSLVELEGKFAGSDDVDFSAKLASIGTALNSFATSLNGSATDLLNNGFKFGGKDSIGSIEQAVQTAQKIKAIIEALPTSAEISAKTAGEKGLGAIGDALNEFVSSVNAFDDAKLASVVESLESFELPDIDVSNFSEQLDKLTESLSSLNDFDMSGLKTIAESLKTTGETIGKGFADSIKSSKNSVQTAVKELVNVASSAIKSDNKSFDQAGRESGVGFATGIGNAASSVTSAVKALVTAATNAIKQAENQFKSAGTKSAKAFATGITSAKAAVTAAAKALVSAATSALSNVETAFKQAGRQAGAGFASGLSSSVLSVRTAAAALANTAKSAANAALEVNSPSRVFMRTGRFVSLGLAKGITENSKWAENASVSMAVGIIRGVQKTLQINSPSKVMIEQGRYVVQGIAEGITEDMSPEEAAKKKAENIKNAFREVFDKFDIRINITEDSFKLWTTQHPNATDMELYQHELESILERIPFLRDTAVAKLAQYNKMVDEFGEKSLEAENAWDEVLKARIELETANYQAFDLRDKIKLDPSIKKIDELSGIIKKLDKVQEENEIQFKRWDTQYKESATDAQLAARTVAELVLELNNLSDKTRMAGEIAREYAAIYGETSEEAIEALKQYNDLVDKTTAKQLELNQATASVDDVISSNWAKLQDDYRKWRAENEKTLLDSGSYSMSEILELAKKATGYDPSKSISEFKKEYQNSLYDLTKDGGIHMEIPVELKAVPDTDMIDSKANARLHQLFSDNQIQNGMTTALALGNAIATTVTDGKVKVNDSLLTVAEALASQAETYQDVGQMLGESLVTGIQMGMAFTDGSGITRIIDFDELRARYQGPVEMTLDGGGFNTKTSYDAAVMATSPIENHTEITVDNSEVVDAIDNLTGRVDMLGETVENLKVYLDTGVLVGQITPAVDRQLGMRATMRERG